MPDLVPYTTRPGWQASNLAAVTQLSGAAAAAAATFHIATHCPGHTGASPKDGASQLFRFLQRNPEAYDQLPRISSENKGGERAVQSLAL